MLVGLASTTEALADTDPHQRNTAETETGRPRPEIVLQTAGKDNVRGRIGGPVGPHNQFSARGRWRAERLHTYRDVMTDGCVKRDTVIERIGRV